MTDTTLRRDYIPFMPVTTKEATVPTDTTKTDPVNLLRDLGNQRTDITLALVSMKAKRAEMDANIERETQRMQALDATITDLVSGKHAVVDKVGDSASVGVTRDCPATPPARKAVLRKRVADKPNPFQDGSARWAIYEYLIKMTKPEHIKQIHASLNGGGGTKRYKYRSVEATVYYFKTRGYVDVSEGIVRSKLV